MQRRTLELQRVNEDLRGQIQERERAEMELDRVMACVSDCLWGAQLAPGSALSYRYCSPRVEGITGRPPGFFMEGGPHRWLSIVHADDRPRVGYALDRVCAGLSEREEQEYRVVLPDGTLRWVRDSTTARQASDGVRYLSGVLSDITARKDAEELRRLKEVRAVAAEREERFRCLIENASDLIVVVDEAMVLSYVSPSAGAVLGCPPAEMVGRNVSSLVHADDLGRFQAAFDVLRSAPGASTEVRLRAKHEGGAWRVLEGTACNLLAKPEVLGVVVNFRDVTERQALEDELRQAQKMEAIGRLAGGIAHDFNNLLGVIMGYVDLLEKDTPLGPSSLTRLDQIRKAANRAAALTRQLLAFSRKQVLQPKVLDLNSLVTDTGNMLRRLIGEDVQLVTRLREGLGSVKADPGQIEQVLMNLAVNARDAMPAGGELTVETGNVELDETYASDHRGVRPGPYVLLAVSDQGCGMDGETLSHIFEPFFTTKELGQGTGLGLSTVFGIVNQSGGHITVASEPGRGTTFKIYFPRTEAPAAETSERPPEAAPPGGFETVLLVEDEEALRELAREVLEGLGYTILEAASGAEALERARNHQGPIDLVLTDVVMPGMSGRELWNELARSRGTARVIYMSGYTDYAIVHQGVLDPGTVFLQKPFTPLALAKAIRSVLDPGATSSPLRSSSPM